jgi:hypothetical protein
MSNSGKNLHKHINLKAHAAINEATQHRQNDQIRTLDNNFKWARRTQSNIDSDHACSQAGLYLNRKVRSLNHM